MTLNQLQWQGFLYTLPIWTLLASVVGYIAWQEIKH